MERRHFLSSLFLVFIFSVGFAQKHYLFRSYTTKDGLPNNSILSINQDRHGYIWFGTDAGVSRYDGYKFDNTIIPAINNNSAFVEYMAKDTSGNLIVTSFMQGVHIQQPNGKFKQYFFQEKRIGANLPNTLKACPNGNIIVGQSRDMYLFKDDKFKKIYDCGSNKHAVNTIEFDSHQNIWIGGFFGLAYFLNGDASYKPHFLPELKNNFVVSILFDKENNLLVGTQQGFYKVIIKPGKGGSVNYSITQPIEELKNVFVNHIFIDQQLGTWVSTSSKGVVVLQNNLVINRLSAENGLLANDVSCTFQDREGNYWFGTYNGVNKLNSFDKYSFSYNDKQITGVSVLVKDNFNRYWLWNGTELIVNSDNKMEEVSLKNTLLSEGGIREIVFSKSGLVWIGNHNGLFSMPLDEGKINLRKLKCRANFKELKANGFMMAKEDREGRLWLGFENGLFVFTNNAFSPCKINIPDAWKMRPYKLVQDNYGYYWLGDFNWGLYRMKLNEKSKGQIEFDDVKIYKSLKPDSSFVNAWIQDLFMDKQGYLWQSSLHTGVYRLKTDRNGVVDYKLYSTNNGLSSNNVTQIIQDNKDNLWFATQNGADVFNAHIQGKDSIFHYNSQNGLGNQVLSILPDKANIYLSYSEGLYSIDMSPQKQAATLPPEVLISQITVMGKPDSLALNTSANYKLRYNQNFLSFEFVSVSFSGENAIAYQYMLEGLDKTWGPLSERRYVTYNSLPPGEYRFKVRSRSPEGIIEKKETSFAFIIKPPFYKTWWFISLSFITLIAIGYFAYHYRVAQLLKVERLRTRIATDLHDDIGSTLSSISIFSEILAAQLDNDPKSAEMIGKIGTNARNMLESMDDIIWAVNPSNDKFQNLGLRIREYAIPLFESKNIKFNIHFSEALTLVQLPMDVRRNVYLIAKEAINNLVKYSGCEEAKIEFKEHHACLEMTIADNGKGFNPLAPTPRNGIKNMQRRADQIKGEFAINSLLDKGTQISLVVKTI